MLDDYFEIGYLLKPHGLKGFINFQLDVDDPTNYKGMESVIVKIGNNLVPFLISSLKISGTKGILQLEGINSVEDAGELKSCSLLLPLELLPKLNENQFYYHDVIGYKIVDKENGSLGVIEYVFTSGNQDLISMKYQDKEVLIPVTDEIVIHADQGKKEVHVNIPEGLLEIYLKE